MIHSEKERNEEVSRYLSLDLSRFSELQDIVDLAAQLCDKPVALITLLDQDVNWLRVRKGVSVEFMPRNTSFCQFGIQQDDVLIVTDASKDPRFNENPLVTEEPHIRFYAGAPLVLSNGYKLGTLCLFDMKTGDLTDIQKKSLATLSRQVTSIMELELSRDLLKEQLEEIKVKNDALMKMAYMQSHDIRHPLTSIMGLVDLIRHGAYEVDQEWMRMIMESAELLDYRIKAIVTESLSNKDLKAIRFSKMVEEIEDYAILILDEKGCIENWNKGAKLLKGYNASEVIGKNFEIFYTEQDKENKRPQALINKALRHGVAKDEGWRLRKNGTRFWGSIVITAIHNEGGEVIGFTKVTRNLSDKVELKQVG